jgi:WD40 repeat protein
MSAEVHGIAFRPDGAQMAAASEDGTVKVLDSRTGRMVQTFPGPGAAAVAVALSPDGRRLISGSRDRALKVRDLARLEIVTDFQKQSSIRARPRPTLKGPTRAPG